MHDDATCNIAHSRPSRQRTSHPARKPPPKSMHHRRIAQQPYTGPKQHHKPKSRCVQHKRRRSALCDDAKVIWKAKNRISAGCPDRLFCGGRPTGRSWPNNPPQYPRCRPNAMEVAAKNHSTPHQTSDAVAKCNNTLSNVAAAPEPAIEQANSPGNVRTGPRPWRVMIHAVSQLRSLVFLTKGFRFCKRVKRMCASEKKLKAGQSVIKTAFLYSNTI